ncbi:MAG TPA: hypothetical protein VGC19_10895 [Rhodanobacter sp.]
MDADNVRRTGKLLRHRKFLESQAESNLHGQLKEARQAQETLAARQGELEVSSQWKAQSVSGTHVDLTLYQHALQYEASGDMAVHAATAAMEHAQAAERLARAGFLRARNEMRVADARHERLSMQWEEANERLQSDWAAYAWLASRERGQ